MKAITKYQCEHCGTQYLTEEAATNCEQNHKHPEKISYTRFSSIANDKTGYPGVLGVEMSDGQVVVYIRK